MRDMIDGANLPEDWLTSIDNNFLAFWKCDEASAADIVDSVTGAAYTMGLKSGVVGTASNIWQGSQSSRDISGGNYNYVTVTGAALTAWMGNLTNLSGGFYSFFRPNGSGGSALRTIITSGSTSNVGNGTRYMLWLYASGADEVKLYHVTSSNSSSSDSGLTLGTDQNTDYMVAVGWGPPLSGTADKMDVYFWIGEIPTDGSAPTMQQSIVRDSTAFDSASVTSQNLRLGEVNSANGELDADVHEAGIFSFTPTDQTINNMFLNAVGTNDQVNWEANNPVQLRVLVEDGDGEWFSLSPTERFPTPINMVNSVQVDLDIANRVQTARVSLLRDVGGYSLSPLKEDSPLNINAAGSYDELLDYMRKIRIEYAFTTPGRIIGENTTANNVVNRTENYVYRTLFEGFVQRSDTDGDFIDVIAADNSVALENTAIESPEDFGTATTAAVTAIQNVITNQEPSSGYKGGSVTVWERDTTTFDLEPVSTDTKVILDQGDVLSTAWHIPEAYGSALWQMYDSDRGFHRLAHFSPERDSPVSAYTFDPQYVHEYSKLSRDPEGLRTKVLVRWGDATNDDGSMAPQETENTASITTTARAKYGVITGVITNGSIVDSTKALNLADATAKDSSSLGMTLSAITNFFPWVELDDYYTFTANNIHFTSDTPLAVNRVQHMIDSAGATTNLVCTGKPRTTLASVRLQEAASRAMVYQGVPPTPKNVTAETNSANSILISWDAALANNYSTNGDRVVGYLVYRSASSSFTANSSTYVGSVSGNKFVWVDESLTNGLVALQSYFQVKAISATGVVSAASSEVDAYVFGIDPTGLTVVTGTSGTLSSGTTYTLGSTGMGGTWTAIYDPDGKFATAGGDYTLADNTRPVSVYVRQLWYSTGTGGNQTVDVNISSFAGASTPYNNTLNPTGVLLISESRNLNAGVGAQGDYAVTNTRVTDNANPSSYIGMAWTVRLTASTGYTDLNATTVMWLKEA